MSEQLKTLVGILLVVVLGLLMIGFFGYSLYESNQLIEKSEPTQATVIDSRTGSSASASDHPVISYTYEWNGTTYRSDSVFPGRGTISRPEPWAQNIVSRYSPNATVTAYVNPDAPEQSFLIKNSSPYLKSTFIAVGLLITYAASRDLFRRLS